MPEGSFLFVDIDSHSLTKIPAPKFIRWILTINSLRAESIVYRLTRRGFHIIIRLNRRIAPMHQVALQSALGDDPMRTALNSMRAEMMTGEFTDEFWRKRWNILYTEKITDGGNGNRSGYNRVRLRRSVDGSV